MSVGLYIAIGTTFIFALLLIIGFIFLIVISRKTHALIEFKASVKGTPIGLFFQDNRYCDWRNTETEAGMIQDKIYGAFLIGTTYIDKVTKNVLVPFNSSYAISLNVKAVKMADDLSYMIKQQEKRKLLKQSIITGLMSETEGVDTLRTSVNFSTVKHYLSPILPHNIQSKIVSVVRLRLNQSGINNIQNIALLIISALGALLLGGLMLRYLVFKNTGT